MIILVMSPCRLSITGQAESSMHIICSRPNEHGELDVMTGVIDPSQIVHHFIQVQTIFKLV